MCFAGNLQRLALGAALGLAGGADLSVDQSLWSSEY